jgi:hypothetical protein
LGIEEEIDALKERNDWGMPFNEEKCVSVEIIESFFDWEHRHALVPWEYNKKAFAFVAGSRDPYGSGFECLTSDRYGRTIYFFRVADEDELYTESYVVMFETDYSFDPESGIMKIADVWDYQDELEAFKSQNGWDAPPVEVPQEKHRDAYPIPLLGYGRVSRFGA